MTTRKHVRFQRNQRIASRAPVLEAIASQHAPDSFEGYVLLVIPHFLKDLPPFIDRLEALGMDRDHSIFVPVFYSLRDYVRRTVEKEGWHVKVASDYGPAFFETVRQALIWTLMTAKRTDRQVLVLEDGGYAVPMLLSEFSDHLDWVAGAVEQTSNGCWRDKAAVTEFRKGHGRPVPFPIVAVGESGLKKVVESPSVADAVMQSVEKLMMRDHKGLRGKSMTIMGFGAVGSRIADSARLRGANVGVYDLDWQKLVAARNRGYRIPNLRLIGITDDLGYELPLLPDQLSPDVRLKLESGASAFLGNRRIWPKLEADLMAFLADSSCILGTSGHCSIGREVIGALKHDTYLASCSSKRLEIDVDSLKRIAIHREEVQKVGTRFLLPSVNGSQPRCITLLADGYPVNFWGDDAESIPTQHIEFVWAQMLNELVRIARQKVTQGGMCAPDPWSTERIALLYLQNSRR